MLLKFWGTRGSIPRPDPDKLKYGGNTSCAEVRTASGQLIVIDCGTGAYALGGSLVSGPNQPVKGAMLISHYHWDHIQGFPFFAPFFVPGNEWDIYAPRGLHQSLRDTLSGQMQYEYFPITLEAFAAKIRYHDLVEGVFEVGDARISTHYLNHPALTLGFRIEADGATLVYACDHESASRRAAPEAKDLQGVEKEHLTFLSNADFVVHDAQYTAEEYARRVGWGHSTGEYAVEACKAAGARRLALSHHDPERNDDALRDIVERLREKLREEGSELLLSAATEGDVIKIEGAEAASAVVERSSFPAVQSVGPAMVRHRLLLGTLRPEAEQIIQQAADAEGIATTAIAKNPNFSDQDVSEQSIIVLDRKAGPEQVAAFAGAAATSGPECIDPTPLLIVADKEGDEGDEPTAGMIRDWLIWPFSKEFVQSRLRAAIFRERFRWVRAPKPDDEVERLTLLRQLNVLDTPEEERFDRITRIACRAFDVPIALVTFIDSDRQWFKSRVGFDASETSRDVAFCAHAILGSGPLIVEDALLDDRFADNPSVTGDPHIRFYAGYPLRINDGTALGSLCLIDFRPHRFDAEKAEMLADLAQIVISELVQA